MGVTSIAPVFLFYASAVMRKICGQTREAKRSVSGPANFARTANAYNLFQEHEEHREYQKPESHEMVPLEHLAFEQQHTEECEHRE